MEPSFADGESPQGATTGWYQTLPDRECSPRHTSIPKSRRRQLHPAVSDASFDFQWDRLNLDLRRKKGLTASMAREYIAVFALCVIIGTTLVGVVSFLPSHSSLPNAAADISQASVTPTSITGRHLVDDRDRLIAETNKQLYAQPPITFLPVMRSVKKQSDVRSGITNISPNGMSAIKDTADNEHDSTDLQKIRSAAKKEVPTNPHSLSMSSSEYFVDMAIGTPPQSFKMLVDTTTSSLIVASTDCQENDCASHSLYDHSKSTTFQNYGEPYLVDQKIVGKFARDDVSIGGIVMKDITFAELSTVRHLAAYGAADWDGVMGMGYTPMQVKESRKLTIFDEMVNRGIVENPIFGLRLGLGKNSLPGDLTLGGYNEKAFTGPISWVPHAEPESSSYWKVNLRRVDVTIRSDAVEVVVEFPTAAPYMILDSSTADIIGPRGDVERLAEHVGVRRMGNTSGDKVVERYHTECSRRSEMPNVEFVVGNGATRLMMTPTDYLTEVDSEAMKEEEKTHHCAFAFVGMEMPPGSEMSSSWVVGRAFIQKYYIIFDHGAKRLGLAAATH